MSRTAPTMIQIDNDRPIDPALDTEFLHALKLGLLLALREQGLLTDLQLRMAQERLGGTP